MKTFPSPSLALKLLKTNRLFQITIAIIVVINAMAYLAFVSESRANSGQFSDFGDAVWWAIVTVATVGYGDLVPRTFAGRIVGSVTIVSGIVLISLFTATISSVFIARKIKESQGLQDITFTGHLLICGWNIHIEELLTIFSKQGQRKAMQQVVLVNDAPADRIESLIGAFHHLDVRFVQRPRQH
jgi:voltage-gated potassium channel